MQGIAWQAARHHVALPFKALEGHAQGWENEGKGRHAVA